jgi:hypothetical protein
MGAVLSMAHPAPPLMGGDPSDPSSSLSFQTRGIYVWILARRVSILPASDDEALRLWVGGDGAASHQREDGVRVFKRVRLRGEGVGEVGAWGGWRGGERG